MNTTMALPWPLSSTIALNRRPPPYLSPFSGRRKRERRIRKIGLLSSITEKGALIHRISAYSGSISISSTTSVLPLCLPRRNVKCQAVGDSSSPPSATVVYQGFYGSWTVEDSDVREVILYRSGLVTAALSFVLASSSVLLPEDSFLHDFIERNLDVFYMIGASGLGLSLYLIHIYVTQIKQTLQAFWMLGVVGSLGTYYMLAKPTGCNLVQYVAENPTAVWFVGPLFAALTGLVFKEGLCYGKLEAGILTFIIPLVLLGHLTGLMDESAKVALISIWAGLFMVFAGRKFTQPIKDDIGDKSVFIFNALPEEDKAKVIQKLELQRQHQNS